MAGATSGMVVDSSVSSWACCDSTVYKFAETAGLEKQWVWSNFFLLECTSVVPVQFKSCCDTYIGWVSLESPSYECGGISIAIMMPTRLMSPLDFILMPFAVMSSACTYPSPC